MRTMSMMVFFKQKLVMYGRNNVFLQFRGYCNVIQFVVARCDML